MRTISVLKRATIILLFVLTLLPAYATVLLDDTWADGTRNNENLPTDAAWYFSSASAVATTTGAMTMTVGGSAVLGVSYFTTNASSQVTLNVGDTLLTTATFTFNGLATGSSSGGFRFAVCDFGTSRVSADFSGNGTQGTNVSAYADFQTMSTTFGSASPINVIKRTTLADSSLFGTGSDWTSMGTGPGNISNFPGFSNGTQYTLQIALQRTGASTMLVTETWVNTATGATISTNETDSSASNFSFDGVAMRPQGASSSATTIIFNEVRVELVTGSSPPTISTQPQDQSVLTGQNATFTASANGSAPLAYQWYYDETTALDGATNATLTITNAQASDIGGYSLTVTNANGSALSDTAELSVSDPTPPSIVAQPQSQTVLPGQSVTFNVEAGGTAPLSYQWYYDTNILVTNATDSTLTLTNVQADQAGTYSVLVSNYVSEITSSNAVLFVNTNPIEPQFTAGPVSQTVLVGGIAGFTASVAGTAPITLQWNKNNVPISGANSLDLTLTNVQLSDAGSYTLTASNSVGSAMSAAAILSVTPGGVPVANSEFDLTGFGRFATGGGVLADTDPNYAKVYTATDFANALISKTVKVIEIMTNLSLGYNEIEASAKAGSEPFRSGDTPLLHPVLLQTGVSVIDIQKKNGLTIFSANGSTIYHAKLNIKSDSNIIIRNLKFDQLWEWDEATKGQYDKNDWDFMTIGDGGAVSNLWVDHCTFSKSYDGIIDTKAGCSGITISWCHYTGDDGATNPNSWVWQQINSLESNKTSYAMYNFLRTRGFTTTNIVTIMQGHDKTHLAGQNDLDANNATITMTFHHLWLNSVWDRCVPRLRGGNVHDYDIYVDDTTVLAAKRLRETIAATMSTADQNTLNNTYDFDPPINGAISTESAALLVEKSVYKDCLWPLRNNQTDPSDPEYTGKIQAIDTIYHMDNSDGSTTDVRGNSTDAGSPMGPFQAPIIPFSWNLPGNQLPYTYTTDDPAQLQAIVTDPQYGAGAGILTWNKTNWLVTTYAPTAPFIVTDVQNQTNAPGDTAVFSVIAGGSAPLNYQWYFDTNSAIATATNSTFTLSDVQSTNAGAFFVVITNSAGSITSSVASLTLNIPGAGFAAWLQTNFTQSQLNDPNTSGPTATPANDGVPNFVKYAMGLQPLVAVTNSLEGFEMESGEGVLTFKHPVGITDVVYQVQVSTDLVNWTTNGITLELAGTEGNGMQDWEAHYSGSSSTERYFRLVFEY
ncbi:MAG TPA: immunoglobulin domain-containing protein [Verrucomicrobiae bacterium]|jgi:pectate lyase